MRFRIPTITLAVVLVFCAANFYSYFSLYTPIFDGMRYFGWPLNMYAEGGFTGTKEVIWSGLLGNVVVALCVAGIADFALTTIKIFVSPNLK